MNGKGQTTEGGGTATGAGAASPRSDSAVRPWERMSGESAAAHSGFLVYRDCEPPRSLTKAAQEMGRHPSLLKRWSSRYRWRERVFAWDVSQAREAEEALRRQREESLQRQARDAEQLQRLGMARLSGLISRDPETGAVRLDSSVTPRDAVTIYKWGVELEDRITGRAETAEPEDVTEQHLRRMSTEQLHELLALATERAGQEREEDGNDGDE